MATLLNNWTLRREGLIVVELSRFDDGEIMLEVHNPDNHGSPTTWADVNLSAKEATSVAQQLQSYAILVEKDNG